MAIEVEVVQDGASFYVFLPGQSDKPGSGAIITAPNRVSDYDTKGAEIARDWFTKIYCPKLNCNPTFI